MAADGLLKSGLKLIGAKTGQTKDSGRKKMYACEPPNVVTYVEPFLGSGNVLVGKQRHKVEIVGDLNREMIMFFHAMQLQPMDLLPKLMEHVARIELGGAEYFHQIRRSPPEEGFLDVCAWYYIVNKYSFNGIVRFNNKGECNSTFCGTTRGRGVYDSDWYSKVVERVDNVHFFCTDYGALLDLANGHPTVNSLVAGVRAPDPETTWVVMDPPYYEVFTKYNKISFKPEDHERMVAYLREAKYRWLVTINDQPAVRELYKGFNFYEHGVFYSCSQTAAGRGVAAELIITNYDIDRDKFHSIISTTGSSR